MRKNDRVFLTPIIVAFCCVMMVGGLAFAQEKFPSKPITIVVPWAAGGGNDLMTRALQPIIEKLAGVSVLVVNRVGAGATIGFGEVMRSAPDGYTLCNISGTLVIVKYTIKDTAVDYEKFEPIIFATYAPQALVVRKEAPWKNLKEFLDYAKANPGKLRVGDPGYGNPHHISLLGIEKAAKVKFIPVHYKGTGAAMPDLLGGHIDAFISSLQDHLNLIKGGVIRAIGVASPERNKFVPDVSTFVELGIDHNILSFQGFVGPKGIPEARVKILNDLFVKAFNTKEMETFCEANGGTISLKGPVEFRKYLTEEDKRWKELITIGGIKPE